MTADLIDLLSQAADRLDGILAQCSPGPWFYNSYSGVFSSPKVQTDESWHEPILKTRHSLERRGPCLACERDGCAHAYESYQQDCLVASVPSWCGDTAAGQAVCNAEYLEAMNPIVGRALVRALRDSLAGYREAGDMTDSLALQRRTAGGQEDPMVSIARAILAGPTATARSGA